MTKTKRYTLLAEGFAENVFIPNFLNTHNSQKLKFIKSNLKISQSSNPSRSKVLNHLNKFVIASLIDNDEDLFIVGVDLDKPDHDLSLLKEQEKEILKKIPKQIDRKKVVVFIPVQAFDHWLLYQSYQLKSERRITNSSLESKTAKEIKKELYGVSKPNSSVIEKKTKEILKVMDYKELVKQSKSFNHFYKQLTPFL
jgi:hypothetical protein